MNYKIIFDNCDCNVGVTEESSAYFDTIEQAEDYITFNKEDIEKNFKGGIAQIVPCELDPNKTLDEQAIKTIDL